jgi:uncharacterized protein with GYD domain
MALYMLRFSYTPQSWAALVKTPENREEKVRGMLEESGATLEHIWYAFGDDDGFALISAPDNITAAAISVAITSTGAFSSFKTSVLLSQEEALEALEKAGSVSYTAPGAREAVPA